MMMMIMIPFKRMLNRSIEKKLGGEEKTRARDSERERERKKTRGIFFSFENPIY